MTVNLMLSTASELTLGLAIVLVGILIAFFGIISGIVSIVLGIKYFKYNHRKNSAGLTGVEAARKILDKNDLQHIKVSATGSLLFGNSYSAYFKKIRLRRFTRKKKSITSLAMGAQKSALAVLHKEGDPDMKKRVRLVPFITFGPLAFIPLIIIGVVLDIFLFHSEGIVTIILFAFALALFIFSIVLSVLMLKTEKKAQERAYELLRENNMATEDEIEQMKKLFKLYNIQYVNDIVISILELIRYILQIALMISKNSRKIKK